MTIECKTIGVLIEVPVTTLANRSRFMPLEVRSVRLDNAQRDTMRQLVSGLISQGAHLKNGQAVQNPAGAFRYMLEKVGEALAESGEVTIPTAMPGTEQVS